jgi:hypothetical protein
MEEWEEAYSKLTGLYSREDTNYGETMTKGHEIEKIVDTLIQDLVKPFNQKIRVKYGENEFDGEVVLGKGKSMLYEIYSQPFLGFRYDSLLSRIRNTYFSRSRTYFLVITKSLEKNEEKVSTLTQKIMKETDKVKLVFMDYNALISLHRFVSSNLRDADLDLKTVKFLFFTKLFEDNTVLNADLFSAAMSSARDEYSVQIQKYEPSAFSPAARIPPQQVIIEESKREISIEEELHELEKLLMHAIDEIRRLRRNLAEKVHD